MPSPVLPLPIRHMLLSKYFIFSVSAFYFECPSKKMKMNASIYTKSKFMGMSIGVSMIGKGDFFFLSYFHVCVCFISIFLCRGSKDFFYLFSSFNFFPLQFLFLLLILQVDKFRDISFAFAIFSCYDIMQLSCFVIIQVNLKIDGLQ